MAGAAWFLSVFGLIWAWIGLLVAGAPWVAFVVPVIVSLGLLQAVRWRAAQMPPRSPREARRVGRLVAIWSALEGLGILIVVNALRNLHRPALILAGVCVVVGLHFLPLARGVPARLYYVSGAALTLWGVAGLTMSQVVTPAMVALGAAAVLWLTMAWLARGTR